MTPVRFIRDLGVYRDADITMRKNVIVTIRSYFAALWQICRTRRSLPCNALLTLIRALVVSKVKYCNCVYISGHLMDRLQSILNTTAWLSFSSRWLEYITPLLRELQWLGVPERIQFQLCVLAYRCHQSTAPPYLAESLHLTIDVFARCRLQSDNSPTLLMPILS